MEGEGFDEETVRRHDLTKFGFREPFEEAGANNALAYTLLANCRIQGLDPEDYLVEVLGRLPANATREQAAALTPKAIAAERRAAAGADEDQAARSTPARLRQGYGGTNGRVETQASHRVPKSTIPWADLVLTGGSEGW